MKINIAKYRWTQEERDAVLDQLLEQAKPKVSTRPKLITVGETLDEVRELRKYGHKVVGVPSGFASLDKLTRGFAPGELVIVFGHTSHGKSQLCQNIAVKLAKQNIPNLFVALEMTKGENSDRLMEIGSYTEEEFETAPIFYPEGTEVTPDEIDILMGDAVQAGAKLAVIDHLHYFSRGGDNEHSEVGRLVHQFKKMAVRHRIPVLLVSHIVKAEEKYFPRLDHLRGSSFIAQDADQVLAVWRNREAPDGTMSVRILKNRNRGFDADNSTISLGIMDGVRLADLSLSSLA